MGMREVRIHGRGGQGVVTAAEMLARAGFLAGHFAQAIPSFGSERTGAPVVSYCRFDDRPIRTREPVLRPQVVLIQDPTLLVSDHPFVGLAPRGLVVVNTEHTAQEVRDRAGEDAQDARLAIVPALRIVLEHLGSPKPSAAMLGAYAAASDDITLEAVQQVFRQRFRGRVGEQNAAAAAEAFAWVREHGIDEPTGRPATDIREVSVRA